METNTNQPIPSVSTSVSVQSVETSKKLNPLIIVLGVVVGILMLVTGFLYMQNMQLQSEISGLKTSSGYMNVTVSPTPVATTDPYADWLNYTNDNYSFALRYPADWEIRDQSSSGNILFGIAPISVKEDFLGSIRITQKTENEIITETKTFPEGTPNVLVSENKINFLSYQATEIITRNTVANVESKTIVFSRDGQTFIVTGGGTADNSVIYQILSTFKFMN